MNYLQLYLLIKMVLLLLQKIVQLHSQGKNQRMKTMYTANTIARLNTGTKSQRLLVLL